MGKEAQDTAKINVTTESEVKSIYTHPSIDDWTIQEISKRRIQITEDSVSKFQPREDRAKRELEKLTIQLNELVESGQAEESAKIILLVAEKKKELSEIRTEWRKNGAENLTLEKWNRILNDRRFETGPQTFLADGRMTRVM